MFAQTPDNVVNPLTGKRTLPSFDQVNYKGDWGVASFHGLMAGLQRTARNGFFLGMNYTYGHAINDSEAPRKMSPAVLARRAPRTTMCGRTSTFSRAIRCRLATSLLLRNWTLSGVGSIRTGLPLTVTVTRKTTDVLDGNNAGQRPNLVPGVSLIPAGGQTINAWINPAAFSIPAKGTWGNAGRALVRAPGLFQIERRSRGASGSRRDNVSLRMEAFNVFNRTELGSPNCESLLAHVWPDPGGQQHQPDRDGLGAQHSTRRALHVLIRGGLAAPVVQSFGEGLYDGCGVQTYLSI